MVYSFVEAISNVFFFFCCNSWWKTTSLMILKLFVRVVVISLLYTVFFGDNKAYNVIYLIAGWFGSWFIHF